MKKERGRDLFFKLYASVTSPSFSSTGKSPLRNESVADAFMIDVTMRFLKPEKITIIRELIGFMSLLT